MTILRDPDLQNLLTSLHERSEAQRSVLVGTGTSGSKGVPTNAEFDAFKAFVSDKLVALDRDKAEFCYQLLRAIDARRVVEIGTSYGVSTLYLAAALRDMAAGNRQARIVIGTEHEPAKVQAARRNLQQAGLASFVEIREGDVRETLQSLTGPIDFVLVDIWTDIARSAIELVHPHLRPGAIVVCDNTNDHEDYADYFNFLCEPSRHFRTMTLPFKGGLEMSVYCPPTFDPSAKTSSPGPG